MRAEMMMEAESNRGDYYNNELSARMSSNNVVKVEGLSTLPYIHVAGVQCSWWGKV